MSIRRKTCETMTLLYEAALKTNPDFDEAKDRPTAINPTPGVQPRKDLGKAIWIKDPSRQQGGYWLARTEEDARKAGVPFENIVIGEFPEKAPVAADTPLPIPHGEAVEYAGPGPGENGTELDVFQDLRGGTNVNPQMNYGDEEGIQGQGEMQYIADFGQAVSYSTLGCHLFLGEWKEVLMDGVIIIVCSRSEYA
jgi:hypothetical protein